MNWPLAHPAVWEDFNDAIRYYASRAGSEIALDFEQCIHQNFALIQATPLLHRARAFQVRRVNMGPQFREWYIAYILSQQTVVVLAIAHGKRRPYYFRERIREAKHLL